MKRSLCAFLLMFTVIFAGCAAGPKSLPQDLNSLKSVTELGEASRLSYQKAKAAPEKQDKLKLAYEGIMYAQKCLEKDPQNSLCLYYNTVNRGFYLKHNFVGYQKSLKIMVQNCETLLKTDPTYENGGCYRILGDIYAKVPSFTLTSNGITRDIDKSVAYLQEAIQKVPAYSLNYLFLTRYLVETDEKTEAKATLAKFDSLRSPSLDTEYPDWKKERDEVAKKLN